jgi:hypothetical protein
MYNYLSFLFRQDRIHSTAVSSAAGMTERIAKASSEFSFLLHEKEAPAWLLICLVWRE